MDKDVVEVDGVIVRANAKLYYMLNKPRGIVTTASDEKGRPTVYDYLGEEGRSLSPVGRLDKASEGLLLFTNDTEWAAQVLAPETHLEKTYHVQVGTHDAASLLDQLVDGIPCEGEALRAKRVRIIRGGKRNTWLEIVLEEGRNRHIRRMFQQLGVEVLRLVRVSIGPLSLGQLPKGQTRVLTAAEKRALDHAMNLTPSRSELRG